MRREVRGVLIESPQKESLIMIFYARLVQPLRGRLTVTGRLLVRLVNSS
jgi:hypothetical protein